MTAKPTPCQLAFQIACLFPGRVPRPRELREAFPHLTRATAYRYVRDYRLAVQAAPDIARQPAVPHASARRLGLSQAEVDAARALGVAL
jgi:hypothetical protein